MYILVSAWLGLQYGNELLGQLADALWVRGFSPRRPSQCQPSRYGAPPIHVQTLDLHLARRISQRSILRECVLPLRAPCASQVTRRRHHQRARRQASLLSPAGWASSGGAQTRDAIHRRRSRQGHHHLLTTIGSCCRSTMPSSVPSSSGHDRPACERYRVDRAQAPIVPTLLGRERLEGFVVVRVHEGRSCCISWSFVLFVRASVVCCVIVVCASSVDCRSIRIRSRYSSMAGSMILPFLWVWVVTRELVVASPPRSRTVCWIALPLPLSC